MGFASMIRIVKDIFPEIWCLYIDSSIDIFVSSNAAKINMYQQVYNTRVILVFFSKNNWVLIATYRYMYNVHVTARSQIAYQSTDWYILHTLHGRVSIIVYLKGVR